MASEAYLTSPSRSCRRLVAVFQFIWLAIAKSSPRSLSVSWRLFSSHSYGGPGAGIISLRWWLASCSWASWMRGRGFPPVREWRLGADFSFFRSFPLISERWPHSGRRQAVRWSLVWGRVRNPPVQAGDTIWWMSAWRGILFFAGITGHFRALGSRLCGSGGCVRKFLFLHSFPLISERWPHSGRRQAVRWGLVWGRVSNPPVHAGGTIWWMSAWRRILFSPGITGHFRALGSCLCRSGGWVRKFLFLRSFPLISERWPHSGRRQAVRWGVAWGRVSNPPVHAGDTIWWMSNWRRILFCPSITGHFRALGSCLCGSGGWVRIFYFPAHFRSFPSVGLVPAMGWAGSSFSGRPG